MACGSCSIEPQQEPEPSAETPTDIADWREGYRLGARNIRMPDSASVSFQTGWMRGSLDFFSIPHVRKPKHRLGAFCPFDPMY
ncbi:MAG: hypothetical protein ABIH21_01410 [Patescibacteria group bacterium]